MWSEVALDTPYMKGRQGVLLVRHAATAAGSSGSCSGGSARVVVPRVFQLMALGVVEQRVVQLVAPGVVVPRVGSPVCRHPAYEQVEGPQLLEPVE